MSTEFKSVKSFTGLYKTKEQNVPFGNGGLAPIYEPGDNNGGYIDVVKDYQWTMSPPSIKSTAPFVILKEYEFNESSVSRQGWFYLNATAVTAKSLVTTTDTMAPYEMLFPKDKPTRFRYRLPYFSDINYSLQTSEWTQLDMLEKIGGAVTGAVDLVDQITNFTGTGKGGTMLGKGAGGLGLGVLGTVYPRVGMVDRPRNFERHTERSIEIKFSLFNTVNADDWIKNRELCTLLINQNLYNKRDFITGIPPVFYEILIPGQHYSYAAAVTNITVYNRGNMRYMEYPDKSADVAPGAIVPDAYEVSIALTDMVMPSKNLFQQSGKKKVHSSMASDKGESNALTDKIKSGTQAVVDFLKKPGDTMTGQEPGRYKPY